MRRTTASSGTEWEQAVGYSRAVRTGGLVHVSGTVATDDAGEIFGAGDPGAQARRALETIGRALTDVGAGFSDVVRTRIYLTDIDDWPAVGEVHGEVFGGIEPATTMIEVGALIDEAALVEIEAEAVVGDREHAA